MSHSILKNTLSLFLSITGGVALAQAVPPTIYQQTAAAMVILHEDNGNPTGSGAITEFGSELFVLTAAHVCISAKRLSKSRPPQRALYINRITDVCVLDVPSDLKASLPYLQLSYVAPEMGTPLLAAGFALARQARMRDIRSYGQLVAFQDQLPNWSGPCPGELISTLGYNPACRTTRGPYMLVNEYFIPGQSGGPVVNAQGLIVGTIVGFQPGFQSGHITLLQELVKGLKHAYLLTKKQKDSE